MLSTTSFCNEQLEALKELESGVYITTSYLEVNSHGKGLSKYHRSSHNVEKRASKQREGEEKISDGVNSNGCNTSTDTSCYMKKMLTLRQSICGWAYNVVDSCGIDRQTVIIAFSYVDRYLSNTTGTDIPVDDFVLICMTSLYTAVKITFPESMISMSDLVVMSKGRFTAIDMRRMEYKIINSLQWRMHPPTALSFLEIYVDMLPPTVGKTSRHKLVKMCRNVFEQTTMDYQFITYRPSSIALAALRHVLTSRCCKVFLTRRERDLFICKLQLITNLQTECTEVRNIYDGIMKLSLGI